MASSLDVAVVSIERPQPKPPDISNRYGVSSAINDDNDGGHLLSETDTNRSISLVSDNMDALKPSMPVSPLGCDTMCNIPASPPARDVSANPALPLGSNVSVRIPASSVDNDVSVSPALPLGSNVRVNPVLRKGSMSVSYLTESSRGNDPVESISSHAMDSSELIRIRGYVNRNPAIVMVDGGSTGNFIDSKYVQEYQLHKHKLGEAKAVRLADGSTHLCRSYAICYVRMGQLRHLILFNVIPLDGYDAILGIPWLRLNNPEFNWEAGVVSVNIDGRLIELPKYIGNEAMDTMGVQLKMSTSHHPQTDGQTERANRVLEDVLRHYVSKNQNDWDMHLTAAEIAVNSSVQASTNFTPYYLNCGYNPTFTFNSAVALRRMS